MKKIYKINNRKNRLVFYKVLLKVICNDPSVRFGFCYYINELTKSDMDIYRLPELYYKRPKDHMTYYPYWFPRTKEGWETRISILVKVINQLEKQLKIK